MFILFKKTRILFCLLFIFITISSLYLLSILVEQNTEMFMGSNLTLTCNNANLELENSYDQSLEKYFRPSNSKVLNTRIIDIPYEQTTDYLKYTKLVNPLLSSPIDTVLNYYSVLRDSANMIKGYGAGCGTIGTATSAYPIAYNFFTKEYMGKHSLNNYINSFKNILHTSLIKIHELEKTQDEIKYFIELELIEGTKDMSGAFKYYYGYIYLKKEDSVYKISNIELFNEVYLCAPFHGWNYEGENIVDIEYGTWCNMVSTRFPTEYSGYIKTIKFNSKEGKEYMIKFITLTNGVDVEIGKYIKENGNFVEFTFDPKSCLEK